MSRIAAIKSVTFDLDATRWGDLGAEDGAFEKAGTCGHR